MRKIKMVPIFATACEVAQCCGLRSNEAYHGVWALTNAES